MQFIQRIAAGQLCSHLGNREAGRFRGQRRRARHARVHFDHDQAAVVRVDGELHVRAAGIDADFTQHRNRGIAHDLIFFVGQRQRRGDGNGITRVHAHRIDVFDGTDDDAVIRTIADHFHLEFFPAQHAFFDQHLIDRRRQHAGRHDALVLFRRIRDAAAGAAQGERWPNHRRQADRLQRHQGLLLGRHRQHGHFFGVAALIGDFDQLVFASEDFRLRRAEADFGHRIAEQQSVFGLGDHFGIGANQLNAVFF